MSKSQEILVAEDEGATADSIKLRLESRGEFTINVVTTAHDALRHLATSVPDALLLDTTLPDMSTSEVCRVIRSRQRTRHLLCILLGERAIGVGLIDGLDVGADDYLMKPVDPDEIEARLKAMLRRRRGPAVSLDVDRFRGAHIDADFGNVAVSVDGVHVSLTRRELTLLRALIGARNQVLSRQTLLISVWGWDASDQRNVDSALYKLRRKLKHAGDQIETVVGFGYRFCEPER